MRHQTHQNMAEHANGGGQEQQTFPATPGRESTKRQRDDGTPEPPSALKKAALQTSPIAEAAAARENEDNDPHASGSTSDPAAVPTPSEAASGGNKATAEGPVPNADEKAAADLMSRLMRRMGAKWVRDGLERMEAGASTPDQPGHADAQTQQQRSDAQSSRRSTRNAPGRRRQSGRGRGSGSGSQQQRAGPPRGPPRASYASAARKARPAQRPAPRRPAKTAKVPKCPAPQGRARIAIAGTSRGVSAQQVRDACGFYGAIRTVEVARDGVVFVEFETCKPDLRAAVRRHRISGITGHVSWARPSRRHRQEQLRQKKSVVQVRCQGGLPWTVSWRDVKRVLRQRGVRGTYVFFQHKAPVIDVPTAHAGRLRGLLSGSGITVARGRGVPKWRLTLAASTSRAPKRQTATGRAANAETPAAARRANEESRDTGKQNDEQTASGTHAEGDKQKGKGAGATGSDCGTEQSSGNEGTGTERS